MHIALTDTSQVFTCMCVRIHMSCNECTDHRSLRACEHSRSVSERSGCDGGQDPHGARQWIQSCLERRETHLSCLVLYRLMWTVCMYEIRHSRFKYGTLTYPTSLSMRWMRWEGSASVPPVVPPPHVFILGHDRVWIPGFQLHACVLHAAWSAIRTGWNKDINI